MDSLGLHVDGLENFLSSFATLMLCFDLKKNEFFCRFRIGILDGMFGE